MKFCTTCNAEYPESERFCPSDGTPLRSRDTANLVGAIIADRYHVMQKLGEGGMGQVYLAEHVRMRRKSAVKVMHPGMASDPDAISRFNREASNACQIQHPNVAAIYDFGESADGVVYLAMEYVEGVSLARLLATEGALSAVRTADIARQIADGLDAAHRLGIVHRDLKPDNVLVGSDHEGRDRVKLVDFGISKATQATQGQTVTRTGQVIGTPDYMSPEQLSGDDVGLRSDVYSLGIVVVNMLTGRLPFQGDSSQSAMLLRLTEQPRRLSALLPSIPWPAELQNVLDRAMDMDAARRFPSASAFAAALEAAASRMTGTALVDARTVLADMAPSVPVATPSASVTPSSLSFPIACGLLPAELAVIESRLAAAVGPIARVLVRRAAAIAPTRSALVSSLADEIDDQRERDAFRRALG